MLRALNKNEVSILAWETEKSEYPFFCPLCREELLLRKGKVKTHHFAHKIKTNCDYAHGESEKHYRIKKQLYEYLKDKVNCKNCDLERNLKTVRPDISLRINNIPVAIEIQNSAIDVKIIQKRMAEYTKMKIYVLWIIPQESPSLEYREKEKVYVHNIKEWEAYLHALNYGKLYYWQGDNSIKAYHFEALEIYKESSVWYDEDGDDHYSRGYNYYARTLKHCTTDNKILFIDKDFIPNQNKGFSKYHIEIPKCLIYRDKYNNWWK